MCRWLATMMTSPGASRFNGKLEGGNLASYNKVENVSKIFENVVKFKRTGNTGTFHHINVFACGSIQWHIYLAVTFLGWR